MEDNGLAPSGGPVVVTGATGGVGTLAIDMLSRLVYRVVALTGKECEAEMLRELGAIDVILRTQIDFENAQPLETGIWAGAIDNVGGSILHWVLARMKQPGTVASVGNAADGKLSTTVFPFILRGVSLLGIDSGYVGFPRRRWVWERLASDLKPRHLESLTRTVALDELPYAFDDFIHGRIKGRRVVRIAA